MSDEPAEGVADTDLLQALLQVHDGVGFVFDADGRYVDVAASDVGESLLYDDARELLGLELADVFPPDRADRFHEAVRSAIDRGTVEALTYRMEVQAGVRWFEASISPFVAADGSDRALWVATDVTESTRRERRLRTNERRFEAIFNDPHVLVGILDPDGTFRRANRTAMDLVDVDLADIEGQPFPETPWWSHSEALQEDLRSWIDRAANGEYVEYESTHFTVDGERLVVDGLLRPVTDESGTVESIIISARDVTRRRRQEQRLDVLHRIVRHDLRNGLNAIHGYAARIENALGEGDARDELVAMASTINREAGDLVDLSAKIDEFRRLDTTTNPSVAVDDLVGRIAEEVTAASPGGALAIDLPDRGVEVPQPVELAVSEAVENAFEHSDRDEPAVEMTCRTSSEPAEVTFRIADDGPGIPRGERGPLTADGETTLDHPSGVGLWLIRWVADRYGGEFSIEANEPRGSVVEFTVPLATEVE